ncbi:hypothetical protein CsSME_00015463 [Camellia sinensis var. sinensis]
MDGLHKIPRGHRFWMSLVDVDKLVSPWEMTPKMMNCWILMSPFLLNATLTNTHTVEVKDYISGFRRFEGYAKRLVVVEINERLVKE